MSYIAMGDLSASTDFNSTKYAGISKPSTVNALAQFKAMQQQLNRVATVTGATTIAADGDIGPGTVSLYKSVVAQLVGWAASEMSGADVIKLNAAVAGNVPLATYADVVTDAARGFADANKAPATAPAPKPTKPPTLVDIQGAEVPAPAMASDLLAAWKGSSTWMKLAAAGILGGIGYMLVRGSKKGGRSSSRYRRNPSRKRMSASAVRNRRRIRARRARQKHRLARLSSGRRKTLKMWG